MSNNEVATLYSDVLTEQGLEDLRNKYPSNLVYDMTDDAVFKAARKTRTERNDLNRKIDRRRIDKAAEVNAMGNSLTEKVTDIYSVIVEPFEAEDKKRKLEAKRIAEQQQKIIDNDRAKINGFRGFIEQAYSGDSKTASSLIDAVTNIDPTTFHKDLIVEAKQAKESILSELGNILSSKLQSEEVDKKNKALQDELDALKAAQSEPEPKIEIEEKLSSIASSNQELGEEAFRLIVVNVKGSKAHIDKVYNEIDMLLTRISPSSQIK